MQMGMGPMQGPAPRRSSNTPLIVGIGCGAAILLAVILVVVAVVATKGDNTASSTSPAPTYSPTNPTDTSVPTDGASPTQAAGTFSNDYEGTWTGRVTSSKDGKWVGAEVHLYPLLGTGLVTYTLSGDNKCFGDMKLLQNGTDKIVMSETISYDKTKCSDGYETLSVSGTSLKYEWRAHETDATPAYSGTLTKSG